MEHEPIKCHDDEFEDGEVNICFIHFSQKENERNIRQKRQQTKLKINEKFQFQFLFTIFPGMVFFRFCLWMNVLSGVHY